MIFDDRPAPAAVGARRDHAEHSAEALLRDASRAAALHAGNRLRSGLGAGTFAALTEVLFFEFDRLLGAGRHFRERKLDLGFQIETAGCTLTWRARAATEAPEAAAEDLIEHREDVGDVHVREVVLPTDPFVTILVIAPPFFRVGEDLI